MKRFALVFVFLVGLAAPVWADFEDGKAAYQRGDYTTALREWRPLAEQGGAQAQLGLGVIYYNWKGVPKDNAEAKKWFRKAAEQDFAAAQYRLGQVYYNERDNAEAANWFRKAVSAGPWRGLPSGRKAAEHAQVESLHYLGTIALWADNDAVMAYMWYTLAIARGSDGARGDLATLKGLAAAGFKKLTPDDVAQAEKLARKWRPAAGQ